MRKIVFIKLLITVWKLVFINKTNSYSTLTTMKINQVFRL